MRIFHAIKAVPVDQLIRLGLLLTAMISSAHTEHDLAVAIGIADPWAWFFPAALDLYATAAFRAHAAKDISIAVLLMIGCQSLAHLIAAGILTPEWWMVIPMSSVVPIVFWRSHHLAPLKKPTSPPAPVPTLAYPDAAPVTPAAPQTAHSVTTARPETAASPAAVPDGVKSKRGRSARETWESAHALMASREGITKKEIAARLNISTSYLRRVLNGPEPAPAALM